MPFKKNPPAKHNTNKFSISDETYTKIGNYINKHLRFKRKFMKTKSKHLLSETSGVFSNAMSHSLINYFRLTYSRGSFTVSILYLIRHASFILIVGLRL